MTYQKVKFRRRREGKTDYGARLALLKSNLPRLIVRKTEHYINTQFAVSKEAQDSVLITVSSKDLLGYGWPAKFAGSLKSIPAAYLTGFLLGNKLKEMKGKIKGIEIKKAILDLGLQRSTKGSRIYAVVKGLLDTGFDIVCSEKLLPDEKRLYARHMKKEISIEDLKNKIQNH